MWYSRHKKVLRRIGWLGLLVVLIGGGWFVVGCWDWLKGMDSPATTIRNLGVVIASAIALPLAIWRSVVAHRQSETQRRGLLNERYQRGADMLGNAAPAVRLGGIYALDWLAEEHSGDYHIQVMGLFSAFVRYPPSAKAREGNEDVQAILAFFCKRDEERVEIERKGRYRLDLRGAKLKGVDLRKIVMPGGDMSDVDLTDADLAEGQLGEGCFRKATLTNAKFVGSDLTGADLGEAELGGADFSDAVLANTDLRGAKGVTQGQLDQAKKIEGAPNLGGLVDAKTGQSLAWTRST